MAHLLLCQRKQARHLESKEKSISLQAENIQTRYLILSKAQEVMNFLDKLFDKLYRYDENLKSNVPTKWSIVFVVSLIVVFVIFVIISISRMP